jgi:hypothetical protein
MYNAQKIKQTRQELLAKRINTGSDQHVSTETDIEIPPESKVGARVQEDVQKNVISMIILILLSIPLLDGSTWFTNTTIYDRGQDIPIFYATYYPS